MKPLPHILMFSVLFAVPSCGKEAIDVGSMNGVDGGTADDAASGDVEPRMGMSCQIGFDYSPSAGVFNANASECESSVCLKPAGAPSSTGAIDTASYCTQSCTQDSDCVGHIRQPNDPNDKGCRLGYACGIAFVKGPLCCKSMCICRDFTGGAAPSVPVGCQGGSALTCNLP